MPIHIEELHSTVDVIDSDALVTPQVIDRIVEEVLHRLAVQQRVRETVRSDLDTRSIVEQQRRAQE